MGKMKDIGLLDCEDRPSIEENFKRVQGGGGGAILDSNGKLKSEVLPDGYPYTGVEERTLNHIFTEETQGFTTLEGFPVFAVGDTVNIKVNGVKYSLVAFDFNGGATIGDFPPEVMGGGGQYRWFLIAGFGNDVGFFSLDNFVVSWETPVTVPMAEEFLPVSPQIINLHIGLIQDGRNVYASPEKRDNQEPMTRDEFLDLVPRNANGDEIPYIVVLTGYGEKYTVFDCKDLGDKIRFYTFVASNGEHIEMRETFTEGGGVD